jgi:hypothetical protein
MLRWKPNSEHFRGKSNVDRSIITRTQMRNVLGFKVQQLISQSFQTMLKMSKLSFIIDSIRQSLVVNFLCIPGMGLYDYTNYAPSIKV